MTKTLIKLSIILINQCDFHVTGAADDGLKSNQNQKNEKGQKKNTELKSKKIQMSLTILKHTQTVHPRTPKKGNFQRLHH